jgi:prepilin-type N-terminal cleavage/methylation domain-containing protein
MECLAEQERIPTLEIGCNKSIKGFTLIEILVVLIIIGIASSLLVINMGLSNTVSDNKNSFQNIFNYLSEESIITGNPIGWFANNKTDSVFILDYDLNQVEELENVKSPWNRFSKNTKTFKSFDGSVLTLEDDALRLPLLIFYPSGENSGGVLNIYDPNFILEITIKNNGTIESKSTTY